jgi:hypothetical protein
MLLPTCGPVSDHVEALAPAGQATWASQRCILPMRRDPCISIAGAGTWPSPQQQCKPAGLHNTNSTQQRPQNHHNYLAWPHSCRSTMPGERQGVGCMPAGPQCKHTTGSLHPQRPVTQHEHMAVMGASPMCLLPEHSDRGPHRGATAAEVSSLPCEECHKPFKAGCQHQQGLAYSSLLHKQCVQPQNQQTNKTACLYGR